MLKLRVFSVFDDKAKAFISPFFLPEVAVAIRAFGNGVMEAGHEFGKHPEDYTLFLLGEFDVSSGRLEVYPSMEAVVNGLELKSKLIADAQRLASRQLQLAK